MSTTTEKIERIPALEPRLRLVVAILVIYTLVRLTLVSVVVFGPYHFPPNQRAAISMMLVVVLVWAAIGGTLQLIYKDRVRAFVMRLRGDWRTKFIVFATIMILIEEACTTTMTNCAPLFGVKIGQAYITASTNYLDVIFGHSVSVIFPFFVAWAILLSFYDFSPTTVFLLFGLTGSIAEMGMGGAGMLAAGFWIFIYGLMVYLPAYCIPTDRQVKRPKFQHYILAIFIPFIFTIPFAGLVHFMHPIQPAHFPPIH
jgi:hypothetical protein